ncbi:hypothetical protein [Streptomyces sp. NPDC003401]
MRRDEKAVNGPAFVLDGPRGAERFAGVAEGVVTRVLERMPRRPTAGLLRAAARA